MKRCLFTSPPCLDGRSPHLYHPGKIDAAGRCCRHCAGAACRKYGSSRDQDARPKKAAHVIDLIASVNNNCGRAKQCDKQRCPAYKRIISFCCAHRLSADSVGAYTAGGEQGLMGRQRTHQQAR